MALRQTTNNPMRGAGAAAAASSASPIGRLEVACPSSISIILGEVAEFHSGATPRAVSSINQKTGATQALLVAAISGFMSVAAACGGKGAAPSPAGSTSHVGSNVADADAAGDDGAAGSDATVMASYADSGTPDTSSAVISTNPHTPIPATKCESGQVPNPKVTSTVVGALTQDEFASRCAALNGIFEIQPLCGGSNSCRGMSYDSGEQTLTEHSCQATNTCAGYSCVVCG